jgi:hypothetical protein
MYKIRSFVIIAVGSFLIATGVGVWAASMTDHRVVGVKAPHVEDIKAAHFEHSSAWTLAEGAIFRP